MALVESVFHLECENGKTNPHFYENVPNIKNVKSKFMGKKQKGAYDHEYKEYPLVKWTLMKGFFSKCQNRKTTPFL